MIDECVDCQHSIYDHETDWEVAVGACLRCECEGYKAEDEEEEEFA